MNHIGLNGANMPNGIGGMAGMQAGANGAAQRGQDDQPDYKVKLNTHIYDYLLKNELYDAARALLNSSSLVISTRQSPKRRPNGLSGDAMDTDSKDNIDLKKPDDLPDAELQVNACFENSFLLDWFTLFWEIFSAPRPNRHPKLNPNAVQYMNHTREQSRLTNEQRQNLLRQPGITPSMAQYRNMVQMNMTRNARMNPAAMQNLTPQQQQQVMQRQQIMQHQQNMERGGSDVEMSGGPRPRSPNGENTPSPSKKPRLELSQFEGGMQVMPKGRMAQMMHDQPVIAPGTTTMQSNADMTNPDFYANGQMRPSMSQGVTSQGGNHALQDYQMQLMLLEQQNKKRLLMARQEQDHYRPDQQSSMGGQQAFAPGTSPQGSRSGPSPNPNDQTKRGTPKLNQPGLPGSPMPDNMPGRGSPGAMNFSNGQMPLEMMKAMNNMGGEGMQIGPNGANMRPPSSHPFNPQMAQQQQQQQQQMEAMRAAQTQQNGRMPNGANWQQGPQAQAQMGPQAGQVSGPMGAGTPQARNVAMPPPQNVPAAGNNQNSQGNQGMNVANNANNNAANGSAPSPAPSATATTPQTTNKQNPKKAKGKEDRKRLNKKQQTAAAAPGEGENLPPTPQPQTSATPLQNKQFEAKAGQAAATNAQSVAPAPAPAAPVAPPPNDTAMMGHFPDMEGLHEGSADLNMDFGGLEGDDVLNHFDFDQFISNDAPQEFDLSAFDTYDGLEAATDA